MISIDIDGPSTMLNSICESIVITQGSVYTSSAPKSPKQQPVVQSVPKSIFSHQLSQSPRLRHVVVDQHEEYLLDSSRTPTPSKSKEKIEVIDTWKDRTVIDGSSTIWRSPSLQSHKATKQTQPSNSVQHFVSTLEPNIVQMRIAPSHEVKYRTSEHIDMPSTFDWSEENPHTPMRPSKPLKSTRDIALSPILINPQLQTKSTSPVPTRHTVDRSCQYSPPATHELASQCYIENFSAGTQVFPYDIPRFLTTQGGTQTSAETSKANPSFDDSGIHAHLQTVSPSLSAASSDNQPSSQPFVLSGADFIRKLNDQRAKASALTVTQFTDGHHYLPISDHEQSALNMPTTTLERSADSGILVDDHLHQVGFPSHLLRPRWTSIFTVLVCPTSSQYR